MEKAGSGLHLYERTPFQTCVVNLAFSVNIFTVISPGSVDFSYEFLTFTDAMETEKLVLNADNDSSDVILIHNRDTLY